MRLPTSFGITDAGLRAMVDRQARSVEMQAAFPGDDDPSDVGYEIIDGVAVIGVHGVLLPGDIDSFTAWWLGAMGYGAIQRDIIAATQDARVTSILLDVSSPGGSVEGLSTLIETMKACEKPIVAHAAGEMCSAAYWLSAHADLITADATAVIGCLGVIVTIPTRSNGSWSVDFISSSTPGKNADPRTADGFAQYQALADDCGALMLGQIAEARQEPSEGFAERYGAGAVMVANVAIDRGMVDALTTTPAQYARALTGDAGLQELKIMANKHGSRLAAALAATRASADTEDTEDDPKVEPAAAADDDAADDAADAGDAGDSDTGDDETEEKTVEQLDQENASLKEEIEELKRQLDEAAGDDEEAEVERDAKAAGPAGAKMLARWREQRAARLESEQKAERAACTALFQATMADGRATPAAKKPLMRLLALDADATVEFLETLPEGCAVDLKRRGEGDGTATAAARSMTKAAATEQIQALSRGQGIPYAQAKAAWIKDNPTAAQSAGMAKPSGD